MSSWCRLMSLSSTTAHIACISASKSDQSSYKSYLRSGSTDHQPPWRRKRAAALCVYAAGLLSHTEAAQHCASAKAITENSATDEWHHITVFYGDHARTYAAGVGPGGAQRAHRGACSTTSAFDSQQVVYPLTQPLRHDPYMTNTQNPFKCIHEPF